MASLGGGRAASRTSGTSSESDGDMWSVACTEEVVSPRADLAKGARQGATNDECQRQRRRQRLYEHSHELLVWYSRRVGELEQENRELRCELAKSVRQRCITEEYDPAKARDSPKTFSLHGADEDCEAQADAERMGASASNIFDADWSKHSMQACRHRIEQRIHSLSYAGQDSGGIPPEASLDTKSGELIGATSPKRATDAEAAALDNASAANTAQDMLDLARLLESLQEPEARVIYQQFARFESETAYLRSVIRTYEDIYLGGGDEEGNPAELLARPEHRASHGRDKLGSRVKPSLLSSDGPFLGIAGRLHAKSEDPQSFPGSMALSPLSRLRSFSNPPLIKTN